MLPHLWKRLPFLVAILCAWNALQAASSTWMDASSKWSVAGNWSNGIPNASTDAATFGSSIAADITVTVDGTFSVQTLTFNNAYADTLSGGTLDIFGNIFFDSTGAYVIDSTLALQTDVQVNQSSTASAGVTISGNIIGTGKSLSAIMSADTTLVLSGTNTYSGGTVLEGTGNGTLKISSDANLGNTSGLLTIVDGILETTQTFTMHRGVNITGPATFSTNDGTTLTIANTISGGMGGNPFTKSNGGTLALTADNTFTTTNGVTLSAGTLSIGKDSNLGDTANIVVLEGGTLHTSASFSSSRQIQLNGTGTIDTASSTTLTWDGTITNMGTIIKQGGGTLILTTDSASASGTIEVDAGVLEVTGNLTSSSLSMQLNGGELTGNGSMNALTMAGGTLRGNGTYASIDATGGTIRPGYSIGTINVTRTYHQQRGVVYEVEISGTQSDRIAASGIATINTGAILTIVPATGNYYVGTSYDILTAASINRLWSVINYPSGFSFDLKLINDSSDAQLTLLNTVLFAGQKINPGNPSAVNDYIKCLAPEQGSDLANVLDAAVALNNKDLNNALDQLTPDLFGAFQLTNSDNNALIALVLSEQLTKLPCSQSGCFCEHCPHSSMDNVWISPLGNFTDVESYQQVRGYETSAGGFVTGYDHCLPMDCLFGLATGYLYTHLDWRHSGGGADIQKAFGAIYGGYHIEWLAIDASITGGANFYDVERKIRFDAIQRRAKNSHMGYFFTPRIGIAFDNTVLTEELLIEAFGSLEYFYLYQPSYSEHGAQSLNLRVHRKTTQLVRPEIGVKILVEMAIGRACLRPYVGVSWIDKIPVGNGKYNAQLIDYENRNCTLTVNTFDDSKNFVSIQGGVKYNIDQFLVTAMYKGDFAHNYTINQVAAELRYDF